jgi:hypothetical protein
MPPPRQIAEVGRSLKDPKGGDSLMRCNGAPASRPSLQSPACAG